MADIRPVLDFLSGYIRITEDEMEKMRQVIHFSSYAKKEIIQKQGDIPRRLAFILQGAVRIYYVDDKSNEHTVHFTFENEPLVAFDSFANQTPTGTSSMALEATDVIWVSHEDFFGFLEAYPKYEQAVRNIMGQYFALEGDHSKLLRINPSKERYEALCRSMPELVNRVPLKYVASYIGMTLETLSRIRAGTL